jgi:hypothetical protein
MSASTWGGHSSTVTVPELTDFIRHAAQEMQGFAQLCNAPTGKALGAGKGDTVQYTFASNLSVSGGVLDENEDIPTGTLDLVSGSYVIKEYGNAVQTTYKLEYLSRLDIEDTFMVALINDMRKLQNTQAFNEFDDTDWVIAFNSTADTIETDGDNATVHNEELSLANLRYCVRQAKKRNIPFYDGESYLYITGVDSLDALAFDSAVTTMLQQQDGRSALNGEIGRVAGCRLVEDNHKIVKMGASSLYDSGFLIGADAVVNEYALVPEVRAESRGMGRFTKMAYYFLGAWKKIYSQSANAKEHVIKVSGAAA